MTLDTTLALTRPQLAIQSVKELMMIVQEMREHLLVEDHDFGVIPGTGDKPTLLLPGMEKLMRALNAVPEYIDICIIRDYDRPLFHYEYECRLVDADTGLALPGGRGRGLCTSMESAFAWRWITEDKVSPRLDKSTLETRVSSISEPAFAVEKAETTGKYGKPAAYWQQFKDAIEDGTARKGKRKTSTGKDMDTWEIGGTLYRIPNPDIFDQINGIMKRAKKRALGDAVKGAANVSEFFTVDLEDLPPSDYVSITPTRPAASLPPPQPTSSSDLKPAEASVIEHTQTEPKALETQPDAKSSIVETVDETDKWFTELEPTWNTIKAFVLKDTWLQFWSIVAAAKIYDNQKHMRNSVQKLQDDGLIIPAQHTLRQAIMVVVSHKNVKYGDGSNILTIPDTKELAESMKKAAGQ